MENFSNILNKINGHELYELFIGEDNCVILKTSDKNKDCLNENCDFIFNNFEKFGFINLKTLNDLFSVVDNKSELIEIVGVSKFFENLRMEILNPHSRKGNFYLPLKNDHRKICLEVTYLRNFDKKEVLFLFKERDETELNFEKLYADSYKDKLTGLFNLNSLKMHLDTIHGTRYIGFMDLDDFKLINDTYSHRVGDELLVRIGYALISIASDDIIFYRRGGDEFVFMGIDLDENQLKKIITKIKLALDNIEFKGRKVKFSIGYSKYEDGCGFTGRELLQAADLAMYKSKAEHQGNEYFISLDEIRNINKTSSIEKEIELLSKKRKRNSTF